VQLLGLSVDPHRLYIERGLPSSFFQPCPWLYFEPPIAHLTQRPREIMEILASDPRSAKAFTPSPSPTFAFPIIHPLTTTPPEAVRQYHILNSLRPWWISQWYLAPSERPVNLIEALLLLLGLLGSGLFLLHRGGQALPGWPAGSERSMGTASALATVSRVDEAQESNTTVASTVSSMR
jgi:hypothetical protein